MLFVLLQDRQSEINAFADSWATDETCTPPSDDPPCVEGSPQKDRAKELCRYINPDGKWVSTKRKRRVWAKNDHVVLFSQMNFYRNGREHRQENFCLFACCDFEDDMVGYTL